VIDDRISVEELQNQKIFRRTLDVYIFSYKT
jgi:hypothetical protein